jgi:hypothetical protein
MRNDVAHYISDGCCASQGQWEGFMGIGAGLASNGMRTEWVLDDDGFLKFTIGHTLHPEDRQWIATKLHLRFSIPKS